MWKRRKKRQGKRTNPKQLGYGVHRFLLQSRQNGSLVSNPVVMGSQERCSFESQTSETFLLAYFW